jgi:hypothetical protein
MLELAAINEPGHQWRALTRRSIAKLVRSPDPPMARADSAVGTRKQAPFGRECTAGLAVGTANGGRNVVARDPGAGLDVAGCPSSSKGVQVPRVQPWWAPAWSEHIEIVPFDQLLAVTKCLGRRADGCDHLPELIRFKCKRVIRTGQPPVDREVLLDHSGTQRDSHRGRHDRLSAVVRKPGGHSELLHQPRDYPEVKTLWRSGVAGRALQHGDIAGAGFARRLQPEGDVGRSGSPCGGR